MLNRDSDLGFSNHYPLGSTALKPQPGGPGQGLFFVWSLNSWSIHCSPVTPHMKRCQPSVKDWRTALTWTKTEQTQDYSNTTAHWHNWLWELAGGLTAGQIPVHPIVVANEWSCSPFQCLTSCSVPQSALRSEQQKEDINKTALKGGQQSANKEPTSASWGFPLLYYRSPSLFNYSIWFKRSRIKALKYSYVFRPCNLTTF